MTWLHLFGMVLVAATVLLTLAVLVASAVALAKGRGRAAAVLLGGLACWCAIHLAFVAAVSASTAERMLAPGEAKRFCGFYLDCHLGAAVVGRHRLTTIGELHARGVFEVVTVEVSSTARAVRLTPYGLHATLVDTTGRRYERDLLAEQAWEAARGGAVPFEQPLEPGGSYRKDVVFDVAAAAPGLALDVRERGLPDDVLEWMLPGDDDSFLHRRTLLALPPAS